MFISKSIGRGFYIEVVPEALVFCSSFANSFASSFPFSAFRFPRSVLRF